MTTTGDTRRLNSGNAECRDYLRTLPVPELRAYVQGAIGAHLYADGLVIGELRLIADRLEWVATSLVVAGIEGSCATYGGLLSTRPARAQVTRETRQPPGRSH